MKLLADEEVLVPLRRRLHLDLERAQTSFEDDLDDLREKYLHKNVQKVFDDVDAPTGERTVEEQLKTWTGASAMVVIFFAFDVKRTVMRKTWRVGK